ncbi:MAG: hypothetical protein ACK50D_00980 [Burkholderiales bacterium]
MTLDIPLLATRDESDTLGRSVIPQNIVVDIIAARRFNAQLAGIDAEMQTVLRWIGAAK